MASRRATLLVLLVLSLTVNIGCTEAEDPKQAYAKAVALYNAEAEALDRLQQRRQRLVNAHNEMVEALKREHLQMAAVGQLGSITSELLGGFSKSGDDAEPLTEDNVLDRLDKLEGIDTESLIKRAAEAGAAMNELPPEVKNQIEKAKRDLDAELAPLDADIAKQRERLETASQAREAAETRMKQ